jgi:hypothetical protein
MRTVALRPGAGSINRPILPTLTDEELEATIPETVHVLERKTG